CCSGRRQTSKTSCSISGPTSTTIARITHWQGKRRIRPRHDHQPISTRFDGNHTVEPSIRRRWLPDLSKARARCGISRPRQYFQRNHSVFLNHSAFRGISSFTPTLQPDTARLPVQSVPVTIRQRQVGDLYSKLKDDVSFRQQWAERTGLGFELVHVGTQNTV